MAQERRRLVRLEIADGRAGKEADARRAATAGRQLERLREIGGRPAAPRAGKIAPQRRGFRARASRRRYPPAHRRRASAPPRAECASCGSSRCRTPPAPHPRGISARDGGGIVAQDAQLAAGRIIFRQLGDALEQRASRRRRRNISARIRLGGAVKPSSTSAANALRRRRHCRSGDRDCANRLCTNARSRISTRFKYVLRQPQPAELPARRRIEEVAVAHARMAFRRRQRAAAQHHLVDHELAVVFAERAFGGADSPDRADRRCASIARRCRKHPR